MITRAGAELSRTATLPSRIVWVDIVKGVAILAVMAHHFVEHPLHYRLRPTGFGIERSAASMWQVATHSAGSVVDAALLWLCGLGYQGVHIFIVASGIGLALADGRRSAAPGYAAFLRKRVVRLLPPYWLFVVVLGGIGAVTKLAHWHPSWLIGLSRREFVINVLLVRDFSERWVNSYPSPLWFIPTILELYLLYPIIAAGMRRSGGVTLVVCLVVTVLYRAFAVFGLDAVPTGTSMQGRATPLMFGLARLFEFALGVWFVGVVRVGAASVGQAGVDTAGADMSASAGNLGNTCATGVGQARVDAVQGSGGAGGVMCDRAAQTSVGGGNAIAGRAATALLRPGWAMGSGLALWLCGFVAASCRPGFVVSDPLLGAGLLLLSYVAASAVASVGVLSRCLADLGRRSYTLFLAHVALIPTCLVFVPRSPVVPRLVVFVVVAYLLARLLDVGLALLQNVRAWAAGAKR